MVEALRIMKRIDSIEVNELEQYRGKDVEIIILPIEGYQPPKEKVNCNDFSFRESQELLKGYKGSISSAVIEERRS